MVKIIYDITKYSETRTVKEVMKSEILDSMSI